MPLAKKAFGSRSQETPAHKASREYTRLLIEFQQLGGSLPKLAKELDVAYAGIRRRVVMSNVAVSSIKNKPSKKFEEQDYEDAAFRVKFEREKGVDEYHAQLAKEYRSGLSLSRLARKIGLSSAAPLYYGVQRAVQRTK